MVGGTLLAYLGGLHYWWPKMTGKLYYEPFAKVSAVIVFVGFNLTFFPQFILGYMGMPRRYHQYPEIDGWQVLNVLSIGRRVDPRVGVVLPAIYLTYSWFKGPPAGAEPVGRDGPRVGDRVAAADRELRGDADRDDARPTPTRNEDAHV